MGGRIAEQVRRALILAAKTAPVVVVIDASACSNDSRTPPTCAAMIEAGVGTGGAAMPSTGGQHSTGGAGNIDAEVGGSGGSTDASKNGG